MRFQTHPKQNGAKKTKKKQNREKIARERASRPEICLKTRPQEELGRWWYKDRATKLLSPARISTSEQAAKHNVTARRRRRRKKKGRSKKQTNKQTNKQKS
jgi:hypothetical protein